MLERRFRVPGPVDLRLTLGPLRCGGSDPTIRVGHDGVWRTTRTPAGPATTRLTRNGDGVAVQAWGRGAEWALEAAPGLVGVLDDDSGFEPRHPVLQELRRRLRGLRIPRTGAVVEALVPTILEQKVIGLEAKRSWAGIVRAWGDPAPGPAGGPPVMLPPSPERLAATPYWAFHRSNVERRRAETVRRACAHARRLEEAAGMAPADAFRRLTALHGLGPWSAAKVALAALGDADAVAVGDYHLPHLVCWALAGEPRGDDARTRAARALSGPPGEGRPAPRGRRRSAAALRPPLGPAPHPGSLISACGRRVHELGDPAEVLRLEDIDPPQPGPGQVRVAVAAAALGFFDDLQIRGLYQERPPLPFTPGAEVCGRVVEAGEGVDAAVVGRRPAGGLRRGRRSPRRPPGRAAAAGG